MKKFTKAGEITWIFGTLLMALGVAVCKKADLGVSMIAAPPFIIYEAIGKFWSGFSVGMVEYLLQGTLLIVLCILIRRFNWRFLLAFLSAVLYGFALDMWLAILGTEPFEELWLRWIMLIVGDVSVAISVAFFFRTYLPLQVYELFVSETADRFRFPINKCKLAFDMSFLALSVVLAFAIFRDANDFDWSKIYQTSFHSIGAGTVITTIINAPLITVAGRLMDLVFEYDPLFPKAYKLLSRKVQADTDINSEENVNT